MGCFFSRNKFEKLTREEVVEAIIALGREESAIESELASKKKEITVLTEEAKRETDRNLKLLKVKKINFAKAETEDLTKRAMYLMYNERMMKKLKSAIDDNKFFEKSAGAPLNAMLADQKSLAAFLNKTLNTRVRSEDVLTSSDELWQEINDSYIENEAIYGTSSDDDNLLAVFEAENQADSELGIVPAAAEKPTTEKPDEKQAEADDE